MRRIAIVTGLLLCSCAHAHYEGAFDPVRTGRGEINIDKLVLPNGETLFRQAMVIDAPPWRVWNLVTDPDSATLVQTWVARAEALSQLGETMEVRLYVRPGAFGVQATDLQIRLDPSTRTISSTAHETDLIRNMQNVYKLDPYGDGNQTLLTGYTQMSLKPWWGGIGLWGAEEKIADSMRNLREAVKLPRYATMTAPIASANQIRVALPGFVTRGVPADLAWTLSRSLAQQLMRKPEWKLITQDEVVALLDYAKKRDMVGCRSSNCEIDIGRAISARKIIDASIGRVGSTFVLSASLVNVEDGAVDRRATAEAANEGELLQAASRLAAELSR